MWVYDNGLRFGNIDVINLTNGEYFICSNDTIFLKNSRPFAKIISIDKRGSEITLKSFSSESLGVYKDINNFNGDVK